MGAIASKVLAALMGLDRRMVLRVGLILAVLCLLALGYCNARDSGRVAEREEIENETAQTVQDLEETYEQIDEDRARGSDNAVTERLRDGSFLLQQPCC